MSVDVGGLTYAVDADFRTMIEVEHLLMGRDTLPEQEAFAKEIMGYNPELSFEDACKNAKCQEALRLFYKDNIPEDLEGAVDRMIWFYGCGKEDKDTGGKKSSKTVYSYKHDFDYIAAGFLQDYKLDILDIGFLHWWKFTSLFSALKDDCKIREIMAYRGTDLKNLDKEQRKHVREMQKLYALPECEMSKEEEELKNRVREALLNGGDVDAVLKNG